MAEWTVTLLNFCLFFSIILPIHSFSETRAKRNADIPFSSDEEESCSLADYCVVDNVTSHSITLRWPCCAGTSFQLTSRNDRFSRKRPAYKCDCIEVFEVSKKVWFNQYGEEEEEEVRKRETEKVLSTTDCFATFENYCPYGDYAITVKSGDQSFSVTQTTLPAVPKWKDVKAVAEDKILVSWQNTYCTKYKKPIYKITWNGPDGVERTEEKTEADVVYPLSFLLPLTKYTIKLRACDNDNHENDENFCSENTTVEITTKPGTPSAPRDARIVEVSSSDMFLKWKKPSSPGGPIDGYVIKALTDESEFILSGSSQHYLLSNLSPSTNYTVTIFAFNMDAGKRLDGEEFTLNSSTRPSELSHMAMLEKFREDITLQLSQMNRLLNDTNETLRTLVGLLPNH